MNICSGPVQAAPQGTRGLLHPSGSRLWHRGLGGFLRHSPLTLLRRDGWFPAGHAMGTGRPASTAGPRGRDRKTEGSETAPQPPPPAPVHTPGRGWGRVRSARTLSHGTEANERFRCRALSTAAAAGLRAVLRPGSVRTRSVTLPRRRLLRRAPPSCSLLLRIWRGAASRGRSPAARGTADELCTRHFAKGVILLADHLNELALGDLRPLWLGKGQPCIPPQQASPCTGHRC